MCIISKIFDNPKPNVHSTATQRVQMMHHSFYITDFATCSLYWLLIDSLAGLLLFALEAVVIK